MKTFLKSSAVRVDPETYGYGESQIFGIDCDSSYCVTVGNIANVSVPLLLLGMTGSYEYMHKE